MTLWDSPAEARLLSIVDELERTQALEGIASVIRRSWAANARRFEPELGDIPQSLGLVSSINVAQLMHRAGQFGTPPGTVRAELRYPNAVILRMGTIEIQVIKAPPQVRTPQWREFNWDADDSHIRHQAARRNTEAYFPDLTDQDDRPLVIGYEDSRLSEGPDPQNLRHLMLVWSGQLDTRATTAGWLGAPSLGALPWFAVTPMWQDDPDDASASSSTRGIAAQPNAVENFSELPEPELHLGVKRIPAEGTS